MLCLDFLDRCRKTREPSAGQVQKGLPYPLLSVTLGIQTVIEYVLMVKKALRSVGERGPQGELDRAPLRKALACR